MNGKLNWPCVEKNWLSKDYPKLEQTWRSNIGNREILILLFMKSVRSSNPNDYNCNRRTDQAQRDRMSLYGEVELRNRLFRENQAKHCQEIEKLRRICCEETDQAGQARIGELSLHQEKNPTTVSQLLTQIQQTFTILKQRAALERLMFPVNPLQFRAPEPCLAAILDCRMIHGILWVLQEMFLNEYLLEKDHPQLSSKIQRIWHHFLAWLRPNQSTMDRIRSGFAALNTPDYRASVIISRGKKSGHNPWQMDHQKAVDAKRGATKPGEYLYTGPMAERRSIPSFSIGTRLDRRVGQVDYISKIDISHNAPNRQRLRNESRIHVRSVDSNKQAGPLCQRHGYESSAFNELKAKAYLIF